MRKRITICFILAMMFLMVGCTKKITYKNNKDYLGGQKIEKEEKKVLTMGTSFIFPLDAAESINGWYTSMYGITETLFVIADDYSVQPLLAEFYIVEGNTWTIKLKENVTFSNGNPVTADIVVRNLQRAGELNERAITLAEAEYEVIDERTFTMTTEEYNPILINELTDPYASIMDIDHIEDFDKGIIGTGPFKLRSYQEDIKVVVERNEAYWDGEVQLDGVEIYYISDEATMMMCLQNGEIDMYVGPDSDALKTFSKDSNYEVVSVAQSRIYMYYLNLERLEEPVRGAINMAIDKANITMLLEGIAIPTEGAFGTDTAYGQVQGASHNIKKAQELLESAGYRKNATGYYEKEGKPLTIEIGYYTARSIDKIVVLMQDQLAQIGIHVKLRNEEDPDATYMTNGDCDLAMYSIIANSSADPYVYLAKTIGTDGSMNVFGYSNETVDRLLGEMYKETDTAKRAEYANQIQQIVLDDNAYSYLAILNKITVLKAGVTNVSEYSPVGYYCVNAKSDMKK